MSGGALDYAGRRLLDTSREVSAHAKNPLHRAFAAHLARVGDALHDLEWVWSGDSEPGSEDAAIRACLAAGAELEAAIDALDEAIARARGEQPETEG